MRSCVNSGPPDVSWWVSGPAIVKGIGAYIVWCMWYVCGMCMKMGFSLVGSILCQQDRSLGTHTMKGALDRGELVSGSS